MARSKPNYLWRAMPTPRSTVDTCELQTLAYDRNTRKPEWLTVARGEPRAVEIIAMRLSADRFRMFPLSEGEPGWPTDQSPGGIIDVEDDTTAAGHQARGEEAIEGGETPEDEGEQTPTEAGSALSGSTTTTRRPAIREERPRRPLTGAAARSARQRQEKGGGDGRHGNR